MTLEALAKSGTLLFSRSTWTEGQFIHAERSYMSKNRTVGGMRLCFCHAPIDGNDPEVADDLWMAYTGPESQQIRKGDDAMAIVLDDVPPEILAALAYFTGRRRHGAEDVKEHAPETPPWHIGPTMRA